MAMGRRVAACLAALLWLTAANAEAMETGRTIVRTQDGRTISFAVERAANDEERMAGLMNRKELATNSGMIFDFENNSVVVMWMKNTLIPLDMLFITAEGRISGIARNAVPLSLERIAAPGPVRYVLEIKGGVAEKLGIRPGDRVEPFGPSP